MPIYAASWQAESKAPGKFLALHNL